MNANYKARLRVPIGKPVITPAAQAALDAGGVEGVLLLARHLHGDWGDIPLEDHLANEVALMSGRRLLSRYNLPKGGEVWIITEADRSVTTILLPEEY